MWAAGLGARLSLGVEPSATVGGAGSFSGRWRRGSVLVEFGMSPPSSADLTGLTGAHVTVRSSLVWTAIAPCIHLDPVFFCGVAMVWTALGASRGRGHTRRLAACCAERRTVRNRHPAGRPLAFRGQADLLATLVRTPITAAGERSGGPLVVGSFTAGLVLEGKFRDESSTPIPILGNGNQPLPSSRPTAEQDDAVFQELFESQFQYVWNALRRLGIPERDLEDVTHDVFVQVHRQRSLFDPGRSVRPGSSVLLSELPLRSAPRSQSPRGSRASIGRA